MIADAVEFISKYRSPGEEDWKEEMTETHFFFTEENFKKLAQKTNFTITYSKKLARSEERIQQIAKDIECNFTHEYPWIQLELKK